jgi:hypothetical protein
VAWLSRQPPGPVLVPDPLTRFLLRFYGPPGGWAPPWQLAARARPGVRYRYELAAPGARPGATGWPPGAAPAVRGPVFDIFVLF